MGAQIALLIQNLPLTATFYTSINMVCLLPLGDSRNLEELALHLMALRNTNVIYPDGIFPSVADIIAFSLMEQCDAGML